MRIWSLCLAVAALCTPALSASHASTAKRIDKESLKIKAGKYRFVNYKTRQGLKYVRNYQQIYTAKGKGDWMTLKTNKKQVVITPSSSNSKCLNAQWNYDIGANGAAALYRCQRKRAYIPLQDQIGERLLEFEVIDLEDPAESEEWVESHNATVSLVKRDPPLRKAKQYFYLMKGHFKGTVQLIPYDHLMNMPTRCVGATSHAASYNRKSRLQDIVRLNPKDKGHHWLVYNSKGKQMFR